MSSWPPWTASCSKTSWSTIYPASPAHPEEFQRLLGGRGREPPCSCRPPVPSPRGELRILGMGMAREEATIESEEPLRARRPDPGHPRGLRRGRADDPGGAVPDHGPERRALQVQGNGLGHDAASSGTPSHKLFDLWHPIEYIGDVGAAIGPIVLGVALHAGQKGYGIGPTALCTFGNDDGRTGRRWWLQCRRRSAR